MERNPLGKEGPLTWGTLTLSPRVLEGIAFPYFEIDSGVPGSRLAIMAGMHPNEVSSMEAALRLKDAFSGAIERGSVTILPIVNMPGLYLHSEFICPIDNKNINFCFPGKADGTFSEALAYALVHEWSSGAEVLIDLHGGDLREDVARFVMCQMVGDTEFDQGTRMLAHSFDADVIVEFAAGQKSNTGRATNALPLLGRRCVMSEAGANGRLCEESIAFHMHGVLNIARQLKLIEGPLVDRKRAGVVLSNFAKMEAPADGRFYLQVQVGEHVEKGQCVARMKDLFGAPIGEMHAPFSGWVVMIVTHNIVCRGEWVLSIGPVVRTL